MIRHDFGRRLGASELRHTSAGTSGRNPMQAQMQSTNRTSTSSRQWPIELARIAGLYLALHAFWLILPLVVDSDEVGTAQTIVTSVSLVLGLVAITAMWKGMRWGWWMMLVITVLNLVLTVPEVLFLEGVLRAGSIIAILAQVAIALLLFRPGARTGN